MAARGPKTTTDGRIVKALPQEVRPASEAQLSTMLQSMAPQIAKAVPRHMNPDRMLRVALTALRTTRNLGLCSVPSFLASVMSLAQLGLEPNTPLGYAYLIPRKKTDPRTRALIGYDCTVMIGYQGMIDLAIRSGMVTSVYAHEVRDGDVFDYDYGTEKFIKHKPSMTGRSKARITHFYAVAKIKDGDPQMEVLSIEDIEARRARSSARDDGPWVTDYVAMGRKTAVRAIYPWIPKSAEMTKAIVLEDAGERGVQSTAWDEQVVNALRAQSIEVPEEKLPEPESTQAPQVTQADAGPVNDPSLDGDHAGDE